MKEARENTVFAVLLKGEVRGMNSNIQIQVAQLIAYEKTSAINFTLQNFELILHFNVNID